MLNLEGGNPLPPNAARSEIAPCFASMIDLDRKVDAASRRVAARSEIAPLRMRRSGG